MSRTRGRLFFVHFIVNEADHDFEGGGISHSPLAALVDFILRLSQGEVDKF
jgi:hypothetical protein